jgi:hypothetical protein
MLLKGEVTIRALRKKVWGLQPVRGTPKGEVHT